MFCSYHNAISRSATLLFCQECMHAGSKSICCSAAIADDFGGYGAQVAANTNIHIIQGREAELHPGHSCSAMHPTCPSICQDDLRARRMPCRCLAKPQCLYGGSLYCKASRGTLSMSTPENRGPCCLGLRLPPMHQTSCACSLEISYTCMALLQCSETVRPAAT